LSLGCLYAEAHKRDKLLLGDGFSKEVILCGITSIGRVKLRRGVNAGLNKGEARNGLAHAIFLWNTVYLERAIASLRSKGGTVIDDEMLKYLLLLGWGNINLMVHA
jgi:hypothetical protein